MKLSLKLASLFLALVLVAQTAPARDTKELDKNWAHPLHQAVIAAVDNTGQLSNAEVEAYSTLMDAAHLGNLLTLHQALPLQKAFSTLSAEPSYGYFLQAIAGNEKLETWLVTNGFIAAGTCNCDSNWDCTSGYSCKSSGCTVEPGSNSNGVCTDDTPAVESVFPIAVLE